MTLTDEQVREFAQKHADHVIHSSVDWGFARRTMAVYAAFDHVGEEWRQRIEEWRDAEEAARAQLERYTFKLVVQVERKEGARR